MITLDRLQQIIPADQALANKALSVALQQIAGITNNPLPTVANVILNLQTTRDLPLINSLSQPVPSDVTNYFTSTFNQGSYSTTRTSIVNILGVASGIGYTGAFSNAISTIATMNTAGLTYTYTTMQKVVDGVYDVPVMEGRPEIVIPSGPYAGTYTDADTCFNTALIPGAESNIANLITLYPKQTSSMNNEWFGMGTQFATEQNNQQTANINFAQFQANQQPSVFGFIYSLPTYGLDTAQSGMSAYIEGVADVSNFYGQCVVGVLREGRNTAALRSAGIDTNSTIPTTPNPPTPPANLIPATYTAVDATQVVQTRFLGHP